MFLADLAKDEQAALIELAEVMIASDGRTTPEEQAMLDDLTAEMGECAPHGLSGRTVELICATVSKPSARAMILLELASLGHVDQEYASQERELLAAISEQWGVASITLIRIEQWAANRVALSGEAIEIIQEVLAETGRR